MGIDDDEVCSVVDGVVVLISDRDVMDYDNECIGRGHVLATHSHMAMSSK